MSKIPQSRKLSLPGPAGSLEAILDMPPDAEAPVGAAVVCHPHPQHGGTMHNKVAHTLARAFARSGFATLRFNFRGTEGSDGKFDNGIGEFDDALAAVDWMRERYADLPLWLSGFSFGAAIAVRAAVATDVSGLISVAPAIYRFAGALDGQPRCPWLVLQGDEDELVSIEETIAWFNSLEPGPELLVLPGAEHFFHGRLSDLRDAAVRFIGHHQHTD
ncbi:MAG: alpha/beta fold hydrolase [Gammaproteobacteria bacterium]|nr:alpha/beta fold hydrolase [Gammaproteobacteria bacterium]MDH3432482.1 alpha/beta fold hydrolase [Gammaproteobacteria bacterium]